MDVPPLIDLYGQPSDEEQLFSASGSGCIDKKQEVACDVFSSWFGIKENRFAENSIGR